MNLIDLSDHLLAEIVLRVQRPRSMIITCRTLHDALSSSAALRVRWGVAHHGPYAVRHACRSGCSSEIVRRILTEDGGPIQQELDAALYDAAARCSGPDGAEAVAALIQHGASHSVTHGVSGDTPLNVACIRGETDIARVLVCAGAKVGFGL